MESLRQNAAMNVNFMKTGALNGGGYRRKQCPFSMLACGSCCTARPIAVSSQFCNNNSNVVMPSGRRRPLVVFMASKSGKNQHSAVPLPEEPYEYFPEAVLLQKEGKKELPLPDFADVSEEELLTSLDLQLESNMDVKTTRHYEIMYLIHEDYADEVQEVVSKVKDFIEERKGTIWRLNDWGMRRLAYKIKKARRANYILMNVEIPAEDINYLKDLLDKDERIIRHLAIKEKQAITEDCPPPPEYRPYSSLSDEEDMEEEEDMDETDEYDDQMEGELEELEEEEEEEEAEEAEDEDEEYDGKQNKGKEGKGKGKGRESQPRRCTHCQTQKTPQWRQGPLGPKSLCNACGVRYKAGGLFPEYRPAKSPTYVSYVHSNSNKKVKEMRGAGLPNLPKPRSLSEPV
uniref:GATA-type domain-containing protein n=1 Tax=Araucaria cunninghamii TaxID=56994 RepID=A0A0D6R7V0_ARACU